MKKILLIIALTFCIFQLALMTVGSTELTVYSSKSDGYFFVEGDNYDDWDECHDASEAEFIYDAYDVIRVGAYYYELDDYDFYRGALFFNTSSIPAGATINSATLSLYGSTDSSATDFDVVIQNGQPTYPHDPLEVGDYLFTHYTGDGGSFNTSTFTTITYNVITLNATGRGWIQKDAGALTKFMIRSSYDISDTPPEADTVIVFWSSEELEAGERRPRLVVSYTVGWAHKWNTQTIGKWNTKEFNKWNGLE